MHMLSYLCFLVDVFCIISSAVEHGLVVTSFFNIFSKHNLFLIFLCLFGRLLSFPG